MTKLFHFHFFQSLPVKMIDELKFVEYNSMCVSAQELADQINEIRSRAPQYRVAPQQTAGAGAGVVVAGPPSCFDAVQELHGRYLRLFGSEKNDAGEMNFLNARQEK
jgi:hypothetical protein